MFFSVIPVAECGAGCVLELLFGLVSATVLQWKTLGIVSGAASSITAMAPAVLTIVALVVITRTVGQPSALTKPFDRGS